MKSNFYFLIVIPALLFSVYEKLNGQYPSPTWAWAKAFYGTKLLESPAIAVDPSNGAVYTAGSYSGTVDFDPGESIFNLDYLGIYADMFISKLDANGNFVWAKPISPSPNGGSCFGYSIVVDPSGNGDVYTTGAFYGSVDFDPGPGTFMLRNSGYPHCNADIFVSRLDSSGNFKWAKKIGGTDEEFGRFITVDPLGQVYITGSFTGTIDLNPTEDSYMLTSAGEHDFFITKLDSSGHFLWAKSIGGTQDDNAFATTIDPKNGDVYITGNFFGQVNFNADDSSHILDSGHNFDIFILKLDSEGNFLWVKPMYGSVSSRGGTGYAIALDPNGSGDVYTTGYFEGEVDFNPDDNEIFNLNSAGSHDVFISKLNSSGNFVWAKGLGGISYDKGNAIAFDPADDGIYIMGDFSQTADFDPGPNTFPLTAVHSNDIFITKLNGNGDFEWAKPVYTKNAYQSSALVQNRGFLYMAGLFVDPKISFDSIVLTNPSNSTIYWDVFIAKLNTTFTTSVAEINKQQINVYPNPVKNELTIEFEGDNFQEVGIIIYNILGEVVYSDTEQYAFHKKTIDLIPLVAGIYFVELNTEGERKVKMVVKE